MKLVVLLVILLTGCATEYKCGYGIAPIMDAPLPSKPDDLTISINCKEVV